MSISLDRELILLVEACDCTGPASRETLEQLIADGIDWSRLFMVAMWNKVLFLLYDRLVELRLIDQALRSGGLPLLLLNHWKQLHRVNAERNKTQAEELAKLGTLLQREGVDYAVGKGGPLLIGRCYVPTSRKSYDLDLLGSREQIDELRRVMALAGYRHAVYSHETGEYSELPSVEVRKWLLHARGLPNFVKRIDALHMDYIIVQVQFKIGSTAKGGWSDAGVMLERAISTSAGLRSVCDEDLLIQLALHIYRETHESSFDDWSMSWNLIKFCDLARFARWISDQGKAADVAARARELGFVEQCVYALDLAGLVYPSAALSTLREQLEPVGRSSAAPSALDVRQRFAQVGRGTQRRESSWASLMEPQTT